MLYLDIIKIITYAIVELTMFCETTNCWVLLIFYIILEMVTATYKSVNQVVKSFLYKMNIIYLYEWHTTTLHHATTNIFITKILLGIA